MTTMTAEQTPKRAQVIVQNFDNEPNLMPGDVLTANLAIDAWVWDGLYVVEIDGEQLIRRVQAVLKGLYVFCDKHRDQGVVIPKSDLRVLALIESGCLFRSVQ